ncbi:MAG: hypothetical protein LPK09_03865, partial [Hymenobacteraceae bacterium]|nr:hypothetical protein [Hymenobacteraceae bacterium]
MKSLLLMWLFLLSAVVTAFAQPDTVSTRPTGAPVILNQDTLFLLYNPVGSFSKEERAQAISSRIRALAEDRFFKPDSINVVENALSVDVLYADRVLMSVTEADAATAKKTRLELAEIYADNMKRSVEAYSEQYSLREILTEIGLA